mmetsp:Transcript_14226/g.59526  ORF Transcript_14226/g.59526 Transcript_14226/m.59526 type:complete len:280 (+) Transcript_14226:1292-2131(+)
MSSSARAPGRRTSHTRMPPSAPPDASSCSLRGSHAAQRTPPVWPAKACAKLPEERSARRSAALLPASSVATATSACVVATGDIATQRTSAEKSSRATAPADGTLASHTPTVQSADPVTNSPLSIGYQVAPHTDRPCALGSTKSGLCVVERASPLPSLPIVFSKPNVSISSRSASLAHVTLYALTHPSAAPASRSRCCAWSIASALTGERLRARLPRPRSSDGACAERTSTRFESSSASLHARAKSHARRPGVPRTPPHSRRRRARVCMAAARDRARCAS